MKKSQFFNIILFSLLVASLTSCENFGGTTTDEHTESDSTEVEAPVSEWVLAATTINDSTRLIVAEAANMIMANDNSNLTILTTRLDSIEAHLAGMSTAEREKYLKEIKSLTAQLAKAKKAAKAQPKTVTKEIKVPTGISQDDYNDLLNENIALSDSLSRTLERINDAPAVPQQNAGKKDEQPKKKGLSKRVFGKKKNP